MDPTELLREGVLQGRRIAVTDDAVAGPLRALGAETVDGYEDLDVLVADGAALFAAAGGGLPGLRAAADGCFAAARDAATASFIPRERGKVVFVAPDDPPTFAALENTARTLGTEWARYGITVVCVGAGEPALVAFLCSEAGDYFSGCALAPAGKGPGL